MDFGAQDARGVLRPHLLLICGDALRLHDLLSVRHALKLRLLVHHAENHVAQLLYLRLEHLLLLQAHHCGLLIAFRQVRLRLGRFLLDLLRSFMLSLLRSGQRSRPDGESPRVRVSMR